MVCAVKTLILLILIIEALRLGVSLFALDKDITQDSRIKQNTEARQAPLNIHVTGPYTTIIKTPDEVLVVEGKK